MNEVAQFIVFAVVLAVILWAKRHGVGSGPAALSLGRLSGKTNRVVGLVGVTAGLAALAGSHILQHEGMVWGGVVCTLLASLFLIAGVIDGLIQAWRNRK